MKRRIEKPKPFNFIFIDDGRTEQEANEAIQYVIDMVISRVLKDYPRTEYDIEIKEMEG